VFTLAKRSSAALTQYRLNACKKASNLLQSNIDY